MNIPDGLYIDNEGDVCVKEDGTGSFYGPQCDRSIGAGMFFGSGDWPWQVGSDCGYMKELLLPIEFFRERKD